MIWNRVKLIHAEDLRRWTRFPEYHAHDGPTLGEYRRLRVAAEAALLVLHDLVSAQEKLAELDVDTPIEYARHEITLPRSLLPGAAEIALPPPDQPSSTIRCDTGIVLGQVLRFPRSWRKRTVVARYVCPSRILNADEITKHKASLASADPEAQKKLAETQTSRYRQPVIFISHRWDATHHPDPEGRQFTKLQALSNCFLIYDYASFPQGGTTPDDEQVLLSVLMGMNALISNVTVLAAPDFLERGWCIYEYLVASMRASIVCDELNAPDFVVLRNLAATVPPVAPERFGHSLESGIQNAKNQRTLETVNTVLPLFNRSQFTVERDREIVRTLLVSELKKMLPGKKEYVQYVGEWLTKSWTEEELREAFASGLKWEPMDVVESFRPFVPRVPSTLAEAVSNGYRLDRMPVQNSMTWLTLLDPSKAFKGFDGLVIGLIAGVIGAGLLVLVILVLLFVFVWWILF